MPHDRSSESDPAEWLRIAKADLQLALIGRAGGALSQLLCFHAQQAAEKALKAILVAHGLPVPRIHNLTALMEHLPASATPPPEVRSAARLTVYAVWIRYPSELETVAEAELQEILELADAVVTWAGAH